MKFVWRNHIANLAAWNSVQVEEVHKLKEYEDLLIMDTEQGSWDFEASFMEEEISEFYFNSLLVQRLLIDYNKLLATGLNQFA
jgi:hypothetical protein